jgi:hypothetical protein
MATAAQAFVDLGADCEADGLTEKNAERIGQELAKTFGVREHEVAILRVERQNLVFAYPLKLHNVGTIPLNDSASVAVRTANSKRPEAINNFAQAKHATVFEAVELTHQQPGQKRDRHATIIQKLMSCPVLGPSGVIGVIQVSRKGPSGPEAGLDFAPADLQKLVVAAAALAKCFK